MKKTYHGIKVNKKWINIELNMSRRYVKKRRQRAKLAKRAISTWLHTWKSKNGRLRNRFFVARTKAVLNSPLAEHNLVPKFLLQVERL